MKNFFLIFLSFSIFMHIQSINLPLIPAGVGDILRWYDAQPPAKQLSHYGLSIYVLATCCALEHIAQGVKNQRFPNDSLTQNTLTVLLRGHREAMERLNALEALEETRVRS